jgi:hypothetical protein
LKRARALSFLYLSGREMNCPKCNSSNVKELDGIC